jgi:hypothetical protein
VQNVRRCDRGLSWRTPVLAGLPSPQISPLRRAGLITLRAYLLIAAALVILKIVQLALGIGGEGSGSDPDAMASVKLLAAVVTTIR